MGSSTTPNPEHLHSLQDNARTFDLPARRRPRTSAPLTATLLRRETRAARVPILTTRPPRCTMWNTIVPCTALEFLSNSNTSSPELWTDRNKRQLDPDILNDDVDMIWALTRETHHSPSTQPYTRLLYAQENCNPKQTRSWCHGCTVSTITEEKHLLSGAQFNSGFNLWKQKQNAVNSFGNQNFNKDIWLTTKSVRTWHIGFTISAYAIPLLLTWTRRGAKRKL